MKNRVLISMLLIVFTSNVSFARIKYFPKFKHQEFVSFSYDLGITQKALLSKTNLNNQKFLDVIHRFGISKSIYKKMSVYGTISFTKDPFGIIKTQQYTTTSYVDYTNDKLFTLGTQYNFGLWKFLSVHPRIGLSYLHFKAPIENESGQISYRSNSTTFLNLALQGRVNITKSIALTGTLEYLQNVDPFSTSNQFKNINTTSVTAGLVINLRNIGMLDPCRRCPVF